MIHPSLIAFSLLFLLAATAEAQSLKIADRKGAKSVTAQELLANPAARDITIAKDAVYGRTMTYRAVPVPELLKGLEIGQQDYVDFVATDKFTTGIPALLLLRPGDPPPQAFVAVEVPGTPWPAMPDKGSETAAPFYVVWQGAQPGEISPEYWVYKLAAVEVSDSPFKKWPVLHVDDSLPATHPVRRGLDRYVAMCISCHRFKGAGQGEQGPDLGQPMNPVDYFQPAALRKFLRSSKQVRDWPDRKMPSFNEEVLSNEDMEALIAWLAYKR